MHKKSWHNSLPFVVFYHLGTVSVTYLICFALKNAISWGIHLEFHDVSSPIYVHGKFSSGQGFYNHILGFSSEF